MTSPLFTCDKKDLDTAYPSHLLRTTVQRAYQHLRTQHRITIAMASNPSQANTGGEDYENTLSRCEAWNGDNAELKRLGIIVLIAYHSGRPEDVEDWGLALLDYRGLPLLYRAMM